MNSHRRTALVALLPLALSSVGHASVRAQTLPRPGELVRLWDVDGALYVGPLLSMSADEIRMVDQADQREYVIPHDRIVTFQRRVVRRRFARNFLAISAGTTLGSAVGTWVFTEGICQGHCSGHDSISLRVGAALGAAIGIPVGVVVGLVAKHRGWSDVALPRSGGLRFSVLPIVGGRGLGVAGSVSWTR